MNQPDEIARRLEQEQGTLYGVGRLQIALTYPSPYSVGMASLGYQTIYRILNGLDDVSAERAFLPDEAMGEVPPLTYESRRALGEFPVVAFSVAYELELPGMFTCLARSGIPPLRAERSHRHPLVVAGGPLTFSNPTPLGQFADLVLMGEGEELVETLVGILAEGGDRASLLARLAGEPGFYVPSEHGESLPAVAKAGPKHLPAYSAVISPESALPNMFLVEAERGCSRACSFCVMRRSTNGGMRIAEVDRILGLLPAHAERVGLVGAAVSDHPRVVELVESLVERGLEVGLSSLRADRLTPRFVESLARGGYRTLTVASDGPSERLRISLEKKIRAKHLLRAAELAGEAGMKNLKTYMMVGVPGEEDADIDELVAFSLEQAERAKPARLVLGVAPFVAKRNTPLDGQPFVGIRKVEARIRRLRQGLRGKVEVRATSARWAWAEYALAQGGWAEGLAAYRAWQEGGSFGAWKRALQDSSVFAQKQGLRVL